MNYGNFLHSESQGRLLSVPWLYSMVVVLTSDRTEVPVIDDIVDILKGRSMEEYRLIWTRGQSLS